MKRTVTNLIAVALAAMALQSVQAQQTASGTQTPAQTQKPMEFSKQITKTISSKYLLYTPTDYGKDPAKKWPLILFLHGSGESGDDLEKVKTHGPPKLVAHGKEFPFIVVSPQCPSPRVGW